LKSPLTFSIKKDEILTLLGHNGAGKTTAIYMLTGVLSPSSGDAFVNGYSIANNLDEV
jgi:ABC-type multidrug transport system ATPase subunit